MINSRYRFINTKLEDQREGDWNQGHEDGQVGRELGAGF